MAADHHRFQSHSQRAKQSLRDFGEGFGNGTLSFNSTSSPSSGGQNDDPRLSPSTTASSSIPSSAASRGFSVFTSPTSTTSSLPSYESNGSMNPSSRFPSQPADPHRPATMASASTRVGHQQQRPSTSGEENGRPAAGQNNGNEVGGGGAGPTKRNFLVPIGGTGARQKLSILSAAQRPRTAQASSAPIGFPPSSIDGGTGASAAASTSYRPPPSSRRTDSPNAVAPSTTTTAAATRSFSGDNVDGLRTQTQRRPSTADLSQRPSRSNSGSGAMDTAGFSPQLASVLAGQISGVPVTAAALDAYTRRAPSTQHQPQSANGNDGAHSPDATPRSVSHTLPKADAVLQPKRSFSDLHLFTSPVSESAPPPPPTTTTGKEKNGAIKTGLRSIFSRSSIGVKGSTRPSTANPISTTQIGAPQLQSASAMATPPSTSNNSLSASTSGQSFTTQSSGDATPMQGQHQRKMSGQSTASQGPSIAHPYRSASRISSQSHNDGYTDASPPRPTRQASVDKAGTSNDYASNGPERTGNDHTASPPSKPLQGYGRRPSRGEGSRPFTAPAPVDAFFRPEIATGASEIDPRTLKQTAPVLSSQSSSTTLRASPAKKSAAQQIKAEAGRGSFAVKDEGLALEREASSQSLSRRFNQSKDLPADPRTEAGPAFYSAPNSSRSLSPTDFSKPSVPLTSPLLASIMGQSLSGNSLSSLSDWEPPKQATEAEAPSARTVQATESGDGAVSPSQSTQSVGETNARPALPAKSRSRQNIEVESSKPLVPEPVARTIASTLVPQDTNPLISSLRGQNKTDAQTYVPPNALKQTRKGTTVGSSSRLGESTGVTTGLTPSSVAPRNATGISPSSSRGVTKPGADGQLSSFGSTDLNEGESSIDTVNLLPDSAWLEVEMALERCRGGDGQIQSATEKGSQLRTVLLPFLALEAETPETQASGNGKYRLGKARRQLFFDWVRQLLFELQSIQTSADRGAILESIACIVESRNLSSFALEEDKDDENTFFVVLGHILNYAIGELNKKGVYQNTLIFSGRLLAVAFFRIEGVASKLLRALPVNRFALERVANEARWEQNGASSDWEAFKRLFPHWLRAFCFEDARSYLKMLDSQSGQGEDDDDDRFLVRQEGVEVEMSGNWLRRWQSDDSELFFSFCRNYHRQSAATLAVQRPSLSLINTGSQNNEAGLFFGGPGFAHLATCIHQKCLSLVHRDILSVTTLSSQKNFNPGETANVLSGSTAGKPRHLEAANRRCTAIIVDIVRSGPIGTSQGTLFAPMLDMHIKCLVKRTSLYDVQGVFCLLDWLDGVLANMESAEINVCELVDIDFLLQTVWLLLKDADHALALMRTIAFCYSNFAILTASTAHRHRFFEQILLNPTIFSKLFLSWSFTIRAYFLHLLVFRLARINDFSNPEDDPDGKSSLRVVKLFSKRLDEIRKRHDELSPQPSSAESQSDEEEAPSKRRPQSFVSTIRRTPSVHQVELSPAMTKAERVLGIGLPDPVLAIKAENKAQSRAAKWLRVLGGKAAGGGGKGKGAVAGKPGSIEQSTDSAYSRGTTIDEAGNGNPSEGGGELAGGPQRLPKLDESDVFSISGATERSASDDGGSVTPKLDNGASDKEFRFDRGTAPNEADSAPSVILGGTNTDPSGVGVGEHISPDMSFDLQNASQGGGGGETGSSQPSRISRAFSRRQSLLPGPALSLVHGETESGNAGTNKEDGRPDDVEEEEEEEEEEHPEPYDRTLHIYAVQSLREYEQTVQEHDDFFSAQQESVTPQVPRLPIQWPAMWSE